MWKIRRLDFPVQRGAALKNMNLLADGLYRLVKLEEDHNPVFPNQETVVEIRDGSTVTNVSTGRHAQISVLRDSRELYGPLTGPYDMRPISELERIDFMARANFNGLAG